MLDVQQQAGSGAAECDNGAALSKRYGTLADRFHAQYIPEPNSGCWLWIGNYKQVDLPYGRLKLPDSKRTVFAHRVSYELHNGVTLGRTNFICHRCDNPCCVNPEHLFLGDKYSNMLDRDKKGRQARGPALGAAISRGHAKRT